MSSLDGERQVNVVRVNDGKPAKKKKSSAKGATKAPGKKTKSKKKAAPAEGKTGRRRTKRKRNPSIDGKGLAMAALGGAVGEILARPAGHLAAGLVKESNAGKAAAGALAGLAVPAVAALGVGLVSPSAAKGMVGAGGAQFTRQILDAASGTKPDGLLTKMGFRPQALPNNVFVKDGQLFERGTDGKDKLLVKFNPEPITLTDEKGASTQGTLLARMGRDALILDGRGRMRMLAGALGDYVPASLDGRAKQGMGDYVPANMNGPGALAKRTRAGGSGWGDKRRF
jgi:hypothetical protein